ncbi:hypothetical protein HID58_006745, partial [Brassica napus]
YEIMTNTKRTEQPVYISCVDEVRYSFVSHLSDALRREGISVFVDSDDLLSKEAQEKVEGARVCVMVLPGNGRVCLEKLGKVLNSQRDIDQVVVPVLYGDSQWYDEWLDELHLRGFSAVYQSRKECNDSELVEEIVRDVNEKLSHMGRIGIYSKLLEIENMVNKQPLGIRCLGIWGMPGIGKTTLAKAFFDQVSGEFDACCFIEDFDKAIHEKRIYRVVAEQLTLGNGGCTKIKEFPEVPPNIETLHLQGTGIRKLPLSAVKSSDRVLANLLAELPGLSDALKLERLTSLVNSNSSSQDLDKLICLELKDCSRLRSLPDMVSLELLTVLDLSGCSKLKTIQGFPRNLKELYLGGTAELNESPAFSFCAPPSHANQVSTLGLKLGSSVMTQLDPSWRNTLVGFAMLMEVEFSEDYYDANGFGISCVCRWINKEGHSRRIERNLHCWSAGQVAPNVQKNHLFVFYDAKMRPSTGEGIDPDILGNLVVFEFFPVNQEMKRLDDSCTVTRCGIYAIKSNTELKMSSPVSSSDPMECSGDQVEEILRVSYDGLEEMDKALFRFIACLLNDENVDSVAPQIASAGVNIDSGLKELATNLPGYHSPSWHNEGEMFETILSDVSNMLNHTPSRDFDDLVGIDAHIAKMIPLLHLESDEVKMVGIWGPPGIDSDICLYHCFSVQPLESLKCMNLRGSLDLREIPDLSHAINLETLDLGGCSSLTKLPYSIGQLHKLKDFDMERCIYMEVLPSGINLESLYYLNLNGCSRLRSFPQLSTSISDLYLDGTSIEEVPGWIENISALTYLSMNGCNKLKKISPNISKLKLLVEVDFSECKALTEESWENHPEEICTSLMIVNMSGNNFERLPDTWISIQPKYLDLGNCRSLVSLPELPTSLSILTANYCESLESIYGCFQQPQMSLQFINCYKLNQQAREFILHSDCAYAILPGGELPAYFTHRVDGNFLTVSLPRISLSRKILSFKACIVVEPRVCWFDFGVIWLFRGGKDNKYFSLSTNIHTKTSHLIIFGFEFSCDGFNDNPAELNYSDVQFEFFGVDHQKEIIKIKECGVQLLELSSSLNGSMKRFKTVNGEMSGDDNAEPSRSRNQMRVSMSKG